MVKVCGDKLRVSKRAGGREDRAGRGGNQQPKTRTPHKDVGKNICWISCKQRDGQDFLVLSETNLAN